MLARKWRPQTFQEVIGQPHVLTALENGLTQNRVHHAYLFSGTRGVGKTTIARIFAKSLNCEKGVTATPCGKCANCLDIDQGRFVDLLEIDAASRTKVDDTRELLDNVQYKPAQGRYKVYLIDEVHMLSKHSFNALLKTLEEPPEYVKFLLATTDPQKLPITVLSRCLQFHLKAILPEQIEQQLNLILSQEKATFELPALNVIAKAADGSMRDALSLTDQALAFGAGNIKYDAVLKMLGTIDQSHLHYLLHFIASANSPKVFEKIQEFVQLGADFSALHQELASLCHQIALMQLQVNANVTKKTAIQLLAERLLPEEVQLFYQIAVEGYKDYNYAPNGKVALEMTVMRMLAFKPANYIDIDDAMLGQVSALKTNTETAEVKPMALPFVTREQPTQSIADVATTTVDENASTQAAPVAEKPAPVQAVSVQPEPVIKDKQQPVQSISTPLKTAEEKPASVQSVSAEPVQSVTAPSVTAQSVPSQSASEQSEPIVENVQNTPMPSAELPDEPLAEAAQTEKKPSQATQFNLAGNTNSRNMLRSHRQKLDKIKKTKAAAGLSSDSVELSEQPVAEQAKQPDIDSTRQSVAVPVIKPEVVAPSSSPQKIQPITSREAQHSEQELPPLSSYGEQSSQPQYDDYGPVESEYFEPHLAGENKNTDQSKRNHQTTEAETPKVTAPQESLPSFEQRESEPTLTLNKNPNIADAANNEQRITTTPVTSKPNNDISALTEGGGTQVHLINDLQYPVAEFDIATYVDDKMTDPWFLDIKAMQLGGFEKLLAKSCVMHKQGQHIQLSLDEAQKHLLNNQKLCEALEHLIRDFYGHQYTVSIEVASTTNADTPLALEQIVYYQFLEKAKTSVINDPIVQMFVRDYSAKVYENSIVPL